MLTLPALGMPHPRSERLNPFRSASLLVGAGLAFFVLRSAAAIPLSQLGFSSASLRYAAIDAFLALLWWSAFSIAIAAWHGFVRRRTGSLIIVVLAHLPTLILIALVDCLLWRLAFSLVTGAPLTMPFAAPLVYWADFDLVSYLAVVLTTEVLRVGRELAAEELRASELERSLNRARLDYLEAQLQPHFIFNSLGTVSELAFEDPKAAYRVLQQLIAIFRNALASRADEISLSDEIAEIEPYLEIQRIRFPDWLHITYRIEPDACECLVPRFVLQPLIENAIRHGLSGRNAQGTIRIDGTLQGQEVVVQVADDGIGLRAVTEQSKTRGIGLANVRHRLEILYGRDDCLGLHANGLNGTIAELRIPIRTRPSTSQIEGSVIQSAAIQPHNTPTRLLRIPRLLRRPWVAIATTWLLFGLLWTQQSIWYFGMLNWRNSWYSLMRVNMVAAVLWALMTPSVLGLSRAVSMRWRSIEIRALVLIPAAFCTAFVHVAAVRALTRDPIPLFSQAWQSVFVVDFVIFFVLTSLGHRILLVNWLHDRETAATALTAELAAAEAQAKKVRGIPSILLNCLESIAKTVARDPAATEKQLTRLADYLRIALQCTDERGVTPAREETLGTALQGLRVMDAYLSALSTIDQC
jgi:Histidine kinase/Histidine kinase-, DNA gyrase B-, and HSP90-like ATPase